MILLLYLSEYEYEYEYEYELGGALDGSDVLIGVKADMHRGALLLSHPIEHGKPIKNVPIHLFVFKFMCLPFPLLFIYLLDSFYHLFVITFISPFLFRSIIHNISFMS